jgi:small neutral amino acid transporter SnatA (MarC family)
MLRTVLFVVVAVDPFGAAVVLARFRERVRCAITGLVVAAALLSVLVPAATLLVRGDQLYLAGDRRGGRRRGAVPLAVPLLAGPAPLAVVAALGARRGRGDAFVAVAVALAVAAGTLWAAARQHRAERSLLEGIAGRGVGAAMVFVAFALIVDGVLGV